MKICVRYMKLVMCFDIFIKFVLENINTNNYETNFYVHGNGSRSTCHPGL